MPDTKPDLPFDEEGICNACRNFERKHGEHAEAIDSNTCWLCIQNFLQP